MMVERKAEQVMEVEQEVSDDPVLEVLAAELN